MPYVNPDSITVIAVLLPALSLIALGLRCYGRLKFCDEAGVDDVLVVAAAVLCTGLGVGLIIGAQLRFVGVSNDMPYDQFKTSMDSRFIRLYKLQYAFWIIYDTAMSFTKLTFLFFFRRIFRGRLYRTAFDTTNWTLIVLNVIWVMVFVSLRVFRCGVHVSRNWLSYEEQMGYCINPFTLMFASSVPNWVMDIAIFVEPLIMTLTLHMQRRRKVQASIVFFMSMLAVVAGLCRMIISIEAFPLRVRSSTSIDMLGITLDQHDISGIFSLAFFWTFIELGIGFLVVCLLSCGRVLEELCFRPVRTFILQYISHKQILKQRAESPVSSSGDSSVLQMSGMPVQPAKQANEIMLMQIDCLPDSLE